ncbi:MAG: capsule biosynthesis protein, partial [Moorea sp. SIO3G5]|nr:capsule biosynthesis protein [Moorena sp. SIO3G5]
MSLTSADELEPSPLLSWQLGQSNLLDWRPVIETNPSLWREAKQRSHFGPMVLIATTVGGSAPLSLPESLLAVALTLRGAQVHTLLCDHSLPA